MTKLTSEVRLPASPVDVWDRIGDFNAVPDWHPAIDESHLEDGGKVRRVAVAGGGESIERLLSLDDTDRRYSYELVKGPMPVSEYRATLQVNDDAGVGSRVVWSSEFTPSGASEADAKAGIEQFLNAGLQNLKRMYG